MRQEVKEMVEMCHEFRQVCVDCTEAMADIQPERLDALTDEEMGLFNQNMLTGRMCMANIMTTLNR